MKIVDGFVNGRNVSILSGIDAANHRSDRAASSAPREPGHQNQSRFQRAKLPDQMREVQIFETRNMFG
jgi:hypothetical protein